MNIVLVCKIHILPQTEISSMSVQSLLNNPDVSKHGDVIKQDVFDDFQVSVSQ